MCTIKRIGISDLSLFISTCRDGKCCFPGNVFPILFHFHSTIRLSYFSNSISGTRLQSYLRFCWKVSVYSYCIIRIRRFINRFRRSYISKRIGLFSGIFRHLIRPGFSITSHGDFIPTNCRLSINSGIYLNRLTLVIIYFTSNFILDNKTSY